MRNLFKTLTALALFASAFSFTDTSATYAANNQIMEVIASRILANITTQIQREGLEATLAGLEERCGAPEKIMSRVIYTRQRGGQDVSYCFDFATNLLTVTSRDRETTLVGTAIWEIPNLTNAEVPAPVADMTSSPNEENENRKSSLEDRKPDLNQDQELNMVFGARLVASDQNSHLYEVTDVFENGGAARARLKDGDIILKINGQNLYGAPEDRVVEYITSLSGKWVRVLYKRGNWRKTVWVELG